MDDWLRELKERDRKKQLELELAKQARLDNKEQGKLERSRSATIQSKANKLKKSRAGLDSVDRLLAKGALRKAGLELPKPETRDFGNMKGQDLRSMLLQRMQQRQKEFEHERVPSEATPSAIPDDVTWPDPNESSEEFEERLLATINSMMAKGS